jgi:site-specific DNA-methyltransferase (adenine-specific)
MDNFICGNSLDVLKTFSDESIDLTVTSPPYDDLRSYQQYEFDFEGIASELFRVTKEGGVLVWVVGDAVVKGSETGTSFRQALKFMELGFRLHDTMIYEKNGSAFPSSKNGNRYTQIFEYMFVLSKGSPKTHNLIIDKPNRWAGYTNFGKPSHYLKDGTKVKADKKNKPTPEFSARNNIWRYNNGHGYSTKDKLDHPAIFPEDLAKDHIITWSVEGDVVLDPFSGSGTTAKVAKMFNRHYIGIDISQKYIDMSIKRLEQVDGH